ncbi:MAG: hypothetical protein RIR39_1277 [Pseudomonadota bacterium]
MLVTNLVQLIHLYKQDVQWYRQIDNIIVNSQ